MKGLKNVMSNKKGVEIMLNTHFPLKLRLRFGEYWISNLSIWKNSLPIASNWWSNVRSRLMIGRYIHKSNHFFLEEVYLPSLSILQLGSRIRLSYLRLFNINLSKIDKFGWFFIILKPNLSIGLIIIKSYSRSLDSVERIANDQIFTVQIFSEFRARSNMNFFFCFSF
jgi:hypothetical protein